MNRRPGQRMNRGRIQQSIASGDSLPLSFWAGGGYWDLSTLSGAQNAAISSAIPSLVGANVLTPSAAVNPKLHMNAVAGLNSARLVEDTATGANFQYLTCNPLSAIFQGSPAGWVVYMQCRTHKSGNKAMWSTLRGDGGSTEQLFGRFNAESLSLQKKTGAGGTTNYTATRHTDPYSYTQIAWVFDGSHVFIYYLAEGQTTLLSQDCGAVDATALSANITRFTFGASVSSVPFEAWSGYITKCAVANTSATAAQIAALFAQVTATNYVRTRAQAPLFIYPGDSITKCDQDQYMNCGHREMLSTFIYDNGLSWYGYANGQGGGGTGIGGAGIYRQGLSGDTWSSANSGQTIAQIKTQALLDISGAPTAVRFYPCIMGDGDNNSLVAPATMAASFKSAAISVLDAGIARDAAFRMSVTTLPPLNRATLAAIDDNAQAFNSLLRDAGGIFDQLDALYPSNKLFRWDSYRSLGDVWSATYYGADASHPLREGHAQMSCHATYGQLWASDGTQTLATWLRGQSPTTAKPCSLTGIITAPAGGSTPTHAVSTTVTAECTRVACKAEFKVDGVVVATMSPVDTYSHFASGTYAHTPKMRYTFSWTPTLVDVGVRTLTVTFTDPDSVTVATSAGVSVTVL